MRVYLQIGLMLLCFLTACDFSPPNPEAQQIDGTNNSPAETAKLQRNANPSPIQSKATLQILDYPGIEQLIAAKHGQVVVLDCWSTSCQPCRKEFPKLVALSNKYREQLACISLSFDYEGIGKPEDQRDKVLTFLQQQAATFDNVLCSLESDGLAEKLNIPSIPVVFVYDRNGKLRKQFDNRNASKTGPFDYEQIETLVAELLQEK